MTTADQPIDSLTLITRGEWIASLPLKDHEDARAMLRAYIATWIGGLAKLIGPNDLQLIAVRDGNTPPPASEWLLKTYNGARTVARLKRSTWNIPFNKYIIRMNNQRLSFVMVGQDAVPRYGDACDEEPSLSWYALVSPREASAEELENTAGAA